MNSTCTTWTSVVINWQITARVTAKYVYLQAPAKMKRASEIILVMKYCFNWPIRLSVCFQVTIPNNEMHKNMMAFEGTVFIVSQELGYTDDPSL